MLSQKYKIIQYHFLQGSRDATPSIVRSPGLFEGFKKEDWSLQRHPTEEKVRSVISHHTKLIGFFFFNNLFHLLLVIRKEKSATVLVVKKPLMNPARSALAGKTRD